MQGLAGVAACSTVLASPPGHASRPTPYTPRFFTPAEWAFLIAACDRLIPADENGPGALALDVPRFIDMQMDTPYASGAQWYMQGPFVQGPDNLGYQLPYAPRDLYRRGIAGMNAHAATRHGRPFAGLAPALQDDLLHGAENGSMTFGDMPSTVFFDQLLANVMEGAFSDPVHGGNTGLGGWTMLGFPGARADFMDWVDRYGAHYPLGSVSISGETA
ncbi:gluconate 2-dehydrogenase subunit gamma [Komagataeibacter europaeus NBRC 3261]|uniref:Gluconate 2-dehydrogenase subunit gamma n=1 Tax=Komagataeibacter europaeus NBRC 3261 TaxID=1234669 RepID=A0A0D6PZW6_KOMEU|nr:gluconate 2-dehydrogenase subunit 3 family protein [Komagataeibacter europaeus]GAN96608.1 gluconate 2-dehydrogenase subunit gamma [Komagataeibacter europaeus NBRC 3261]